MRDEVRKNLREGKGILESVMKQDRGLISDDRL